jgi:cytochrome P450
MAHPGSDSTTAARSESYDRLIRLRHAQRDPIRFLEDLASQGPVVAFRLESQQAFLLNDAELVLDALVTNDAKFAKPAALERASRLLGRGLLTAGGTLHAARRKAIAPAFHRQRMSGYADVVVARAAAWRAHRREGEALDAVQEMAALTLGVVGESFFSTDLQPIAADLRRLLDTAVTALDPLVSVIAPTRKLKAVRERLDAIVGELIDSRLACDTPPEDLLTLLIGAQGPEATAEQLHDDVLTLLLAGHDTIANALTWTWGWLGEHPGAEAAMHAEIDTVLGGTAATIADVVRLPYTRAVLAESLRLTPPAWVIARKALEHHWFAGVCVPPRSLVVMSPYVLHRTPQYFPDPLTYDPSRWLDPRAATPPRLAYVPFGAGRRSCIGESFAWLEGVLVLATIGQHWRLCPLQGRGRIEARITLRPSGPVMVRLAARS